ncbi:hotdog family protein [Marinomonas ostreistagni]|uniref:Hotdog family protein n=1 Tax=Marinomonas ostreistagni TaxID=359209 RepID=A0ABS0Z9K7_9GAMM|nr:hotdog family protein [Marinomonas ostreistagni]MBJ7550324.1 hotdog family protein [Marinomonas ostreistagni]
MQKYSVEELVPHSGRMSLLSRVTVVEGDSLFAEVDIHEGATFAEQNGVPAWVGLEYLAQAIGAYAGYQERTQDGVPKIGFLLGTRKYSCNCEYFPLGTTLTLKVTRNMQADNGLSAFDGELYAEGINASARLNVFQPDNAEEFLKEA